MKTFVGSDFHWGHKNILKFNPATRKYKDVTDMNERMIVEWNSIASPDDTIYMLGDVSFLPPEKTVEYLSRCNGRKILVAGNHDERSLGNDHFRNCFAEIHNYLEITHNGTLVVMCHYPFAEWNGAHRGSVNLHGHLHGSTSGLEKYRSKDVGMDATGKILSNIDDILEVAMRGVVKQHH